MTAKLRALLAVVGTLIIGGTGYLVVRPLPGVTRADLVDAGVLGFCDPALVECQVRSNPLCPLPDGGPRPRYGTLRTKALVCDRDAGAPALLFRWPKANGTECFEIAGDPSDVCTVLEVGTCSDGTLCPEDSSGEQPVRAVLGKCACRAAAGVCRVPLLDGGTPADKALWTGTNTRPAPSGVTFPPPFAGPGCVEKVCSILNGDQGSDWPDTCPP